MNIPRINSSIEIEIEKKYIIQKWIQVSRSQRNKPNELKLERKDKENKIGFSLTGSRGSLVFYEGLVRGVFCII